MSDEDDTFQAEVGDFFQDRSSPEMEWDYWEVEKRFICPDEGDRAYYKLRSHHPLGKFNRQKTVPDITLEAMYAATEEEVEMAASEVTR